MPGFKRRFADRIGKAFGVEIVPIDRVSERHESRFIGKLLTSLQVDCVFDVGANIGQFGRLLRNSGFTGTILSFEPAPKAYRTLIQCVDSDKNWHANNLALGSTEARLPLRIMKEDVFTSFRNPSREEDVTWASENQVVDVVEIDVRRLDSLFQTYATKYGFSRPFLKMDTQGFDLEVLQGAGDSLSKFVGVSSEIAIRRLYDSSPTMVDSIAHIVDKGFEFVNFLPVHPDRVLNPIELNSYAVRRELST